MNIARRNGGIALSRPSHLLARQDPPEREKGGGGGDI